MTISTDIQKHLLSRLLALISECPSMGISSLEEAENCTEELAKMVSKVALQYFVDQISAKKCHQGTALECPCGKKARFVNYRQRHIVTLHGEITVKRAYYHCQACGSGQIPWDKANGLNQRVYTPQLKAHVAFTMSQMPYQAGCNLMKRLTGFDIKVSSAEEIVLEMGQRLRSEENAEIQNAEEASVCALAELLGEEVPPLVAPTVPSHAVHAKQGDRLYVSLDGVMAHIDKEWHEIKSTAVYTAKKDEKGRDTLLKSAYAGAREPASQFGKRFSRLACAWSVGSYAEVVALADGAHSNWKLIEEVFPKAIQILDFYHASEHLSEVADAVHGVGSASSKALWKTLSDLLKDRGSKPVQAALKSIETDDVKARDVIRRECNYFKTNENRTQYPDYLSKGLMIGSGVIEATCKVLVSQRLKQSGMRWVQAGADAIIALRARILNGDEAALQRCARAT